MPLDPLYQFLSKKLGVSIDELKEKVKEKIDKFSGLINEEGALALVAKEYGIDITPFLLEKRLTISFLVPGLKNVEISVKLGKKIVETEKAINYYIHDETGTAKLVCWGFAKDKIKEFKEGDILRIKVERVVEKGIMEIHINNPDSIRPEENEKIIDLLKNIDIEAGKIIDTLGLIFETNGKKVFYSFSGRLYKIEDDKTDEYIGKIVRLKGSIKEGKLKVLYLEKVNEDNLLRKALMMSDVRSE